MRRLSAVVFALFAFTGLKGSQLDSLGQSLVRLNDDTSKVNTYRKLSAGWLPVNPRKAIDYSLKGLELSRKLNHEAGVVGCLISAGHSYNAIGIHDTALLYTDSAIALAEQLGDTSRLALVYINRGSIMVDMKRLSRAQEDFEVALAFAEVSGNKDRLARAGMALGNVLYYQQQWEKAREHYRNSLAVFEKLDNKVMQALLLMNIGNCARNEKDFVTGEDFYLRAIAMQKEVNDRINLMTTYGNLAILYEEKGDSALALKNYEASYAIAAELDDKEQMALNGAYVGEQYILQGKVKEGIRLVEQAYLFALQNNYQEERLNAAEILAHGWAKAGDFRKAYLLSEEASQLRDSLEAERQDELVVRMQAQLEGAKKDKEIELLNKDKQLQLNDALRQRQLKNVFLAGAAMLALLALVLFNRFQLKRKSAKELAEKNVQINAEKERAEASERFKHQFLANMSHEIRTPMNAIMGMSRLLMDKSFDEKSNAYIKAIRHSSENLLVIINDILDLSKLQAGKMELEKVPFNIKEVLEMTCNALRIRADEKGIKLELITGNLPEYVTGDAGRLTQIMMNLVGNAIKFTEKGAVYVQAETVHREKDAYDVEFSVRDTGIGINSSKIGEVFSGFAQADVSHSRRFGGTGLGLTIVRDLVRLHGGSLAVESKEGEGSVFYFTIQYEESSQPEKTAQHDANPVARYRDACLKILIADDNIYNTIVAADTLAKYLPGSLITYAATGTEVIRLLETGFVPDIILMDVQMPDMDGYETSRYIREHYAAAGICIVALTASVISTEKEKCISSGMNAFVAKPFNDEELLAPFIDLIEKEERYFAPAGPDEKTGEDKYRNLFLDLVPKRTEVLDAALKKNDWQTIKKTIHLMQPQLLDAGMTELKPLLEEFESMDGKTPYLKWHANTKEFMRVVEAKLAVLANN